MDHELISEVDYDSLPSEPEQRFLALEAICRDNMLRLITHETERAYDDSLRLHYMGIVAAAASELGVEGLWSPSPEGDIEAQMKAFSLEVSQVTTRLRLRTSGTYSPHSVQLSNRTKARIRIEAERVRRAVEDSDFDERRKRDIFNKLDELLEEVERPRARFANVMAVLTFVSVSVASGTSFLADAPEAIATIASLIGADKVAEDNERGRLAAPTKRPALPAPATRPDSSQELEDEIPF